MRSVNTASIYPKAIRKQKVERVFSCVKLGCQTLAEAVSARLTRFYRRHVIRCRLVYAIAGHGQRLRRGLERRRPRAAGEGGIRRADVQAARVVGNNGPQDQAPRRAAGL